MRNILDVEKAIEHIGEMEKTIEIVNPVRKPKREKNVGNVTLILIMAMYLVMFLVGLQILLAVRYWHCNKMDVYCRGCNGTNFTLEVSLCENSQLDLDWLERTKKWLIAGLLFMYILGFIIGLKDLWDESARSKSNWKGCVGRGVCYVVIVTVVGVVSVVAVNWNEDSLSTN